MLNNILDFDGRDSQTVSRRLPAGAQVIVGSRALLTDLSGQTPAFQLARPREVVTIPKQGDWYAVSMSAFQHTFGFSELWSYHIAVLPNRPFQLGFFSTQAVLRVAHLQGLERWIRERESVGCDELVQAMYEDLHLAACGAVESVLHDVHEYNACLQAREALEKAVRKALFFHLFQQGLCMSPESFHIAGFSKPVVVLQ